MTDESAVKVCIRVRPLLKREETAKPAQLFWKADEKAIHQIDAGNSSKSFSFDRVFTADETTSQLYQDIAKPLVVSTVEGYNGTIFAYGQTSSGKTFTMMGGGRIPGVIPLAVEDVFQSIKNFPKKEFLLRVSYMEIYNETVTDLLVDSWKRKPLEVRETINKNIYVAELTEELITSSAQALAWIRKGEKNRHYSKTKMNQRSSRSHAIFRMILESRERSDPASGENADGAVIVSHLNLVDLAGSERASQTGAEGARFKEGCHINRSLLILGQVMKKLTDESQKGYTNYRDSKLTRILQNSLGGNAKTVIICTITPITLEETLSTLQFASTAKKMKNDPHVTEVSDDGALLKRYRNEIVDLKRRLQEVSGVTHATATEKDFLSLLLQEKDQLQREQQDRIRNLTKLLVTSSNLVLVQKMPKRRVTWGGKMLRLAHPSACDDGSSDVSFAEPFSRKRKADCLTELGEEDEDEDFDSHWGIPDEPSVDMETSQSSGDSPKDFVSPNQLQEISGKVSNLEVQLEMESQQKEEAMTKIEALDGQVAELHLQLEMEEQQKQEAEEMMQTTEQRAAELQLQLQTETQQRLEAVEKVEMLEFRLTDLERRLEDHRTTQTESDQQDSLVAERDYLKQELGMFIEQMNSLEKENAALSQDLEEKRELEEFETLEEEFRKEHENKLESVSEQLKTKTEFAEELQSMSGKDLVQEVATLRRSLDDAEGLSRDTKKEWAILRSQNMALEEVNGSLTADHQQMETEVTSLRFTLDAEKSRYRQMQSDLQKELNVAFDENTKLTSLLDGKVPKDVMDSVELERKVAVLNKELTASREAAKVLRAQLASFQTLPNTVDSLTKQVCELNEELGAVQTQRDNLLCVHEDEAQQLRDSLQTSQQELSAAALRETELSQHCADVTQQLESLRSDLQRLDAERSRLTAPGEERGPEIRTLTEELERARAERDDLLSERTVDTQASSEETEMLQSRLMSLSAERDKLQETVEGLRQEKQQLRAELEDRMEAISAVQDKLSCQEELNLQQRSEGGEREAELQELLQEQLKSHGEGRAQAAAEAEAAQRSLRDANTTISALREQLSSSEQNVGETTSSRLQESARQLQELLGVFQHLIDTCAKYNFTMLDEVLTQDCRLKDTQLSSLTKPTKAAYDAVCQLEQAALQSFTQIEEQLHVRAQGISSLFEQLVQKDLDVFEERRLQDLLLSRAPAASHSVTDHDLHSVWEQRLTELLDRRLLYLQKMDIISKRLRTHQGSFILELRAEVKDREKLKEQMQTLIGNQPIGCSQLDSLLRQEMNRRLTTARGKMRPLQAIVEEEDGLFEELKQLQDQVDSQLREAKTKSWTLLQALEGAPLQTELSLLKDNQQLALQLQHSQHTARALHVQKEQLEEAQVKASSRISSHKQATQLLQTELQDSRALLEDQENTIQTLRSRLRELERKEPPSAAELEKLQSKLFKLEVKLSSALDQHQQEVQTMTTLLSAKEASLRKLKETLRKSQQQGDESFLQGKDLHTRLTHPRGLVMKSSVMLEMEVTQLQLKITELESLISSQRAEISKWKNRAIKLNMSKAEVKLSPPRTPTKRGLPMASTSFNLLSSPKKSLLTPKKMLEPCGKLLDSPKLSLLNSPKSGFFDGDGASEVLSRTCPKQFFDNSSLGTIPEVSYVPDSPGAEKDGAAGVDRKERPWPQSPTEEEMCKSQ
ncbi:centromere-associated protein E-like isoform X3 [Embiotoca jacksoni]|uniref:centromere-associated protein E-like isoform X3 n=1 Tax=Embiotoca jacksoni TaxID=100190 RepID=UPI003704C893